MLIGALRVTPTAVDNVGQRAISQAVLPLPCLSATRTLHGQNVAGSHSMVVNVNDPSRHVSTCPTYYPKRHGNTSTPQSEDTVGWNIEGCLTALSPTYTM
jgi:hypothetical protein